MAVSRSRLSTARRFALLAGALAIALLVGRLWRDGRERSGGRAQTVVERAPEREPLVEPPPALRTTSGEPEAGSPAGEVEAARPAQESSGVLEILFLRRGLAVEGVHCTLQPQTSATEAWTGVSDRSGLVVFGDLGAGYYHVETFHSDGYGYRVAAGERKSVEIELPGEFLVRGRVVGPDGEPVAGASICATLRADHARTRTVAVADARGRFELDTYLEGYWFAQAAGFAPSNSSWVSEATVLEEVLFELQAIEPVDGQVLDPDGRPVVGAHVTLGPCERVYLPDAGGKSRGVYPAPVRVQTDGEGRYRAELRAGGYRQVSVVAQGFVVFVGHAHPGQTILLEPGESLRGVVTDENGTPLEAALVESLQVDACARRSCWTDEAGRFTLDRASARELQTIVVARDGYLDERRVLPPAENELVVVLRARE